MVGHVLGDKFRHLLVRGVLVLGRLDHISLGNLTRPLIRHLRDGNVGNGRVRQDMRLKLGRCHLVALDLDELLDAVDDDDVIVALGGFGHVDFVARPEPAAVGVVDKSLGRGFFIVQVPENNGG